MPLYTFVQSPDSISYSFKTWKIQAQQQRDSNKMYNEDAAVIGNESHSSVWEFSQQRVYHGGQWDRRFLKIFEISRNILQFCALDRKIVLNTYP